MSSVVEYLESKHIKYELQGQEAIIVCPGCGKDKLSINTNSLLFQCFHCKAEDPNSDYASGHLSKLKRLWNDVIDITPTPLPSYIKNRNQEERDYTDLVNRYHFNLLQSKKGKKYLFKRGFDEDVIIKYKLGLVEMKGDTWISIPSYEDGIPKLLKYRKITNNNPETKKYEREAGGKSILFNGDALEHFTDVFICEGEMDSIVLLEQGFKNSVGTTGGAGTLLPEWYDKLKLMSKITFIFDADAAGQNAVVKTWAERLGYGKCWNTLLPEGEDLNSYFLKYTVEDFKELEPYQFKISGVVSIHDSLCEMWEMSQSKEQLVYTLPWPEVNKLIGSGLELKELFVIGAQSSMGKTTAAMQIAQHFVDVHKLPSLFFCLEMPNIKLATKLLQLKYDLVYEEIKYEDGLIYANDLQGYEMYTAYTPNISMDKLYNTIEEARNRYGVKFVVFDNLQLLITSNKESEYSKAMKMFKQIAMSLNIIVCLVSQPTKLKGEEKPVFDDLKGSSAIGQAADVVLLLHRKRLKGDKTESSFEPICNFILDKSRYNSGGQVRMLLNGAKSRFESLI